MKTKSDLYLLEAIKRESEFYRAQLELIRQDHRKTKARRLADSAITFWDAIKAEAKKTNSHS